MPPRPIFQTLDAIWSALEQLQLPLALMGGLAMSTWKHVRATQDVDLLVGIGSIEPAEILQCVAARGFRAKRTPPVTALGRLRVIQLEFEPEEAFVDVQADLLLADSEYHTQALQRRVLRQLTGLSGDLFVLSCEDLILHKLLADRMIDRADVAALLHANRDSLDMPYLTSWADHLGLVGRLRKIGAEQIQTDR